MVEIGGRPILWHILKIYGHFGCNDFLVACGYKAEVVKRFFLDYRDQSSDLVVDYAKGSIERINTRVEPWRVGVIDTGAATMTGGRIKRLAGLLGDRTFMMTYGDGVADIDIDALLRFHRGHGRLATFTAVRRPNQFGVPRLEGDRAVSFLEKPSDESDWISGGFFVLEPKVLDYIAGDATSFEMDSLQRLAEDGELMAYRHHGFWHPMDTLRDVRLLNSLWAGGKPSWKLWS
jgi:glucose-1-phosphate cytidylyltransferase